MTDKNLKTSRRGFLLGAGAGGAAAATAVLVGRSELPLSSAEPVRPAPVERGGGYHLSEHVASYYRSAKV